MSRGRTGAVYRKNQRYNPDKPDRYEYKCDECGGPLGDTHAVITLASGGYSKSVCDNCATKIANNNFYSLKDKDPEETLDDFDEL